MGKHVTGGKRGITSNLCQARENMKPVPSAGKHVTGAKSGKTCNRCQVQENTLPVPSAGKQVAGAKREKSRESQIMIVCGFVQDWPRKSKIFPPIDKCTFHEHTQLIKVRGKTLY